MTISLPKIDSEEVVRERARRRAASLTYSTGFGNEQSSEALAGALPVGRSSPQRPAYGLYTELLSGTAFTELRGNNRRTWLYRIRPSITRPRLKRVDNGALLTPPFADVPLEPNILRWPGRPAPTAGTDFVSGLWTVGGNGDPAQRSGLAIHFYSADKSMTDRVFSTVDGELMIIPALGGLLIHTELGLLSVEPGSMALIPRAIKFRVEILAAAGRGNTPAFVSGYVCENFGAPFALPTLGLIGATGLANPRDFRAPTAAYDDHDRPVEVIQKIGGNLWSSTADHSPLDVVAWHGTHVPYVYDLMTFQAVGMIRFDHTDPSTGTALTSPTSTPGLANVDFAVYPPRWVVGDDTFTPAYFHRNVSSEFVGALSEGAQAAENFPVGSAELTNMLTPHGQAVSVWEHASHSDLAPERLDGLFFMWETQLPITLTSQATQAARIVSNGYDEESGKNTYQRHFSP